MRALIFRELSPGDITAYDHRGDYQGRIVPARGGFEVLTYELHFGFRPHHVVAGWFPSLDDAKHGLVNA